MKNLRGSEANNDYDPQVIGMARHLGLFLQGSWNSTRADFGSEIFTMSHTLSRNDFNMPCPAEGLAHRRDESLQRGVIDDHHFLSFAPTRDTNG